MFARKTKKSPDKNSEEKIILQKLHGYQNFELIVNPL
jgi:hypothetical protein